MVVEISRSVVPEITPEPFIDKPGGSAPARNVTVIGPVPEKSKLKSNVPPSVTDPKLPVGVIQIGGDVIKNIPLTYL